MKQIRAKAQLAVLFLATAFGSTVARAWGEDGHCIVAAIARAHLTPDAAKGVAALLGPENLDDKNVASWPDYIKKDRHETAPWHYIDIPLSAPAGDPSSYCGSRSCVTQKIDEFRQLLARPEPPSETRKEALKYLVHFVGDLHQPLHCTDDHDAGGNKVTVHYPGDPKTSNFHQMLDHLVLHDMENHQGPRAYAAALDARLTNAAIANILVLTTSNEWATESHAIGVQLYGERPARAGTGSSVWEIQPSYAQNHRAIFELQLQRAGIRLAAALNAAFAQSAMATAAPDSPKSTFSVPPVPDHPSRK